jgi:hypothetical protein
VISAADVVAERLAQLQAERRPGLSPSRVAACRRQSAYLLHGTPRSDEPDRRAAQLGTIIHAGWASLLAGHPDLAVERKRPLSGPSGALDLEGTPDWVSIDDDTFEIAVGDLKTKGRRAFRTWLAKGPDQDTWDQLHIYAAAIHDGSDRDSVARGEEPMSHLFSWFVQIVALDRESVTEEEWTTAADLDRGRMLAGRLAALERDLLAADPDDAPQDGTGSGFPCDWCDWKARCWS